MAAFYVQKDGEHFGPLSRDELQQYIAAGVLSVEDWAIEEGKDAWVPLGTFVQAPPESPAIATLDSSQAIEAVDNNQTTASQYGVRSIPTLLLFKDGEVVETIVGLQDKPQLQAILDKHIGA